MKRNFEEPKLNLEQFTVCDQLTVSWVTPGEDETNPINGSAIG